MCVLVFFLLSLTLAYGTRFPSPHPFWKARPCCRDGSSLPSRDVRCATTAIEDIGLFVASIIVDPRTLNWYVFAYGEHLTQNQYIAVAREITSEDVFYIPVSEKEFLPLQTNRRQCSPSYGRRAPCNICTTAGSRGIMNPLTRCTSVA